ncbi:MAG: hypothetical protein M1470_14410 [Bacteroidetes bacterium]|nr:hypothetical protein [Bacteroidota bacterium]
MKTYPVAELYHDVVNYNVVLNGIYMQKDRKPHTYRHFSSHTTAEVRISFC